MIKVMQVFKNEFQADKWYAYVASEDDGWYIGPFNSQDEAEAYQPEDEYEAVMRVFQGQDYES